jgi:isocitrate dehydrogenase (NAD+)
VAGANYGTDVAVFEAAHGSAPKHAGKDRANPTGLILSGALLLRHVGEADAAARVEGAVAEVLRDGRSLTYDVVADDDAAVGTAAFADAVVSRLH